MPPPFAIGLLAAAGFALAAGCGGGRSPDIAVSRRSVIYGDDGREEPFAGGQPGWLTQATSTRLLALGARTLLSLSPAGQVTVNAPTLQQRLDVCEGEAFAGQPSFALCSAVIVSSRYALTAAHCVRDLPLTELVGLGGFFYEASGELHTPISRDIHAFSRVAAIDDHRDYAWLELAEPIAGLAVVSTGPIASGDAVVGVNHGGGLPAKVMSSTAVRVDDASFLSTLDAFGGASGGPVFSASGELVGILTSGAADYEETVDGCLTAAHLADTRDAAAELAVRAGVALDGLCAAAHDPELCPSAASPASDPGCSISPATARARVDATAVLVSSIPIVLVGWARRRRAVRP